MSRPPDSLPGPSWDQEAFEPAPFAQHQRGGAPGLLAYGHLATRPGGQTAGGEVWMAPNKKKEP